MRRFLPRLLRRRVPYRCAVKHTARQIRAQDIGKGQSAVRTSEGGGPDRHRLRRDVFRKGGNTFFTRCGSPLVTRNGKRGEFIGCSAYPKCRFTKNI
ncbi:MAG: topoisomerase DNA-binding C4 zinc finger domain-containing protein [Lachnospiraceae bacterium]